MNQELLDALRSAIDKRNMASLSLLRSEEKALRALIAMNVKPEPVAEKKTAMRPSDYSIKQLCDAMMKNDGNITRTASELGIKYGSMHAWYRKMLSVPGFMMK